MEVIFKILGPPELVTEGQRGATISPQLWCVLVSLLMTPKVSIPVETLIDHLWDENPTPKARSTVRSYISRIERVLSRATDGAVQVRHAHGYTLDVDPQRVDLHRFRSLRRQSDALADSGETQQAAALLRDAEAVWQGDALAGLPGAWIERMRNTLREELRSATVRRIDLELAHGHHAELLAELGELSDRYPMDEALAGHRMVALFRSGRQADALQVYQDTRSRLTAWGIEPSPDLARLHERILRHDSELAITPIHRRSDSRPQPDTLPHDIPDFVGRTEEVRQLTLGLGSSQENRPVLAIIEGMGGVGKTALAVRAAHLVADRYPDARLFLDLRAHDPVNEMVNPIDALRELLVMLGVSTAKIPGSLRERTLLWRAELSSRRAVIILDDVADPDQVAPLLPELGNCLVIATSRRRNPEWSHERRVILRVLPENDAVSLFNQIAGPQGDQDQGRQAEIARLCGFLPLAIRLMASRIRAPAAPTLLELIEEWRGPVIARRHADEVSRQIEAAFELSYRQLSADEQCFLRYIGICPCHDISIESGAAISGYSPAAAEAAFGTLASHHLLEQTSSGQYVFHDLIRAFAAARFAKENSEPEARFAVGRLADHYIHAVQRADTVIHEHSGEPQPAESDALVTPPLVDVSAARTWLESEWSNALRVAQYCSRHEWKRRCSDLVHALAKFLEAGGYWDDALTAHRMALQASRDLDDLPGTARAAFDLSLISLKTGHGEEALQDASAAAAAYAELGDSGGHAAALDRIGVIHRNMTRFREALAYHQEALGIYRDIDDKRGLAEALAHSGAALGELGRHAEAMNSLNEALQNYRMSRDLRGQAITLNNIGVAKYYRGYHKDAMRSWQNSIDIFHEIGGRQNLALLDHNMGQLHQYKGHCKAAIAMYRQALATYRSLGDVQHQARVLADIGSAYQSLEQFDEALAHYQNAASLGEAVGDSYVSIRVLCGIADTDFGAGRLDLALENYKRAAKLSGEIESLYLKARALNGMAETMFRTRGPRVARIYWREAHDIFAQLGAAEAATVALRLNAGGTSGI